MDGALDASINKLIDGHSRVFIKVLAMILIKTHILDCVAFVSAYLSGSVCLSQYL